MFPKELVHGFGQKNKSFSIFVLMQMEQEKAIGEVSEQKEAFLPIKTIELKEAQKLHCSMVWSKN